jgi:hypothetical protein
VAALHEAFQRLQPQGSDRWNFLAAFTHLGDRYGPYQPGASGLSELLGSRDRPSRRPGGPLARLRSDRAAPEEKSELEEAMAQVVEAFRFLASRVTQLEDRLAAQDHPLDGPSWLVPALELGPWVDPVAAHLTASAPQGDLLHGDCGEGELLDALRAAGRTAVGVEPRGAVALRALERGHAVTLSEVFDAVAGRDAGSLGGLVLSGVVDRVPLHALLPLLSQARRALGLGAPLVIVASQPALADQWDTVARDVVPARPLHERTWEVLLERAGFVRVAPLSGAPGDPSRFAVAACTPS